MNNTIWISEEEQTLLSRMHKHFMRRLLFYPEWSNSKLTTERKRLKEINFPSCCFAYIMVGNTKRMVYLTHDKKTAFKLDGYSNSYMPWSKFTFIRWCSTFDL